MEVLYAFTDLISQWLYKIALKSFGIKLLPRQRKRYAVAITIVIGILLLGVVMHLLNSIFYSNDELPSVHVDFQQMKDNKKMGKKRQVDFSHRRSDDEESYQYNWPDRITEGSKFNSPKKKVNTKRPQTKDDNVPAKAEGPEHVRKVLVPEPPNPPDACYVERVTTHSATVKWVAPLVGIPFRPIKGDPNQYIYEVTITFDDTTELLYEGPELSTFASDLEPQISYTIGIKSTNSMGKSSATECVIQFTTVAEQGFNLIANPSFELSGPPFFSHHWAKDYADKRFAEFWEPYLNPYSIDYDVRRSGGSSLKIAATQNGDKFGAIQLVNINQKKAAEILLAGWSAAQDVSKQQDDGYCLHFDILYEDDTFHYGKSLQFGVGTHDWERRCMIFSPEKPVKSVAVYVSEFEHTGTVWFDDIELTSHISQEDQETCFKYVPSSSSHGCCPKRTSILATAEPPEESVSIATQLTVDRLPSLERMLENWGGHISAAIYLLGKDDAKKVQEAIARNSKLQEFVDFHLVTATEVYAFKQLGLYPVNSLRNEAMMKARTSHVFVLDVDFVVNEGAYQNIHAFMPYIAENPLTAFVVPAFEMTSPEYEKTLPRDRAELVDMGTSKIRQVHRDKWDPAHKPTNYDRWALADDFYEIFWMSEYEPYIIISKDSAPKWDERFVGYGFDKVQHAAELHFAGFQFVGVPDVFIVHMDHGSPPWRGKGDHLRVRVYENYYCFLEEMLVKYSNPQFLKKQQIVKSDDV